MGGQHQHGYEGLQAWHFFPNGDVNHISSSRHSLYHDEGWGADLGTGRMRFPPSGDLQIQACVGAAPPSTAWGSYGAYAAPRPSQTGDRRSVSSAFPAALTLDLTRTQS